MICRIEGVYLCDTALEVQGPEGWEKVQQRAQARRQLRSDQGQLLQLLPQGLQQEAQLYR